MKTDNGAKPGPKYRELSPAEQAEYIMAGKPFMYEMHIVFKGDICISPFGGRAKEFNLEDMVMENAATLDMTHTAPFIPDAPTLKKYAEILENTSRKVTTQLRNVHFAGYESIRAVERVDEPDDNKEEP